MKKTDKKAFTTLILVFFFWGFVAANNDILIPVFKDALNLQNWQSQLINFAFYMAYTIGSLLYTIHARFAKKDLVSSLGYQNSIALGLVISALGTLLFIPAAYLNAYGLMISGLFIVGLGFSLQQTAANPFAILLGDPKSGSQRLSLAGGINNIGTTIGPLILAYVIFGSVTQVKPTIGIEAIMKPYLILGFTFLIVAAIFYIAGKKIKTNKVEISDEIVPIETGKFVLKEHPQLWMGMIAIFCYVGVEVATAGNLGEYINSEMPELGNDKIAPFVALYWASLMIGRWVSAASVFTKKASISTFLKIILPYFAFGIFILSSTIAGYEITLFLNYMFIIPIIIIADLLSKDNAAKQLLLFSFLGSLALIIGIYTKGIVSIYAFVSVGLFCSTLWPCIYTLATKNLGAFTSKGSSLLIMMIMGGAVLSLTQGALADHPFVGIKNSYYVGVFALIYLMFYAIRMKKIKKPTE